MNIFTISSLTAFIISFLLAIFVSLKGVHNKLARAIVPVILCAGTWCFFPFLAVMGGDKNALFLTRIVYIAAIYTAPSFLYFGLTILDLENEPKEKNLIKISFLLSTFAFLPFSFSPFFIKKALLYRPYFSVEAGPVYFLFILFFGMVCLYCFYKLFIALGQSKGSRKNQLKYVFIGFLFAFIGGLIHFSTALGVPEIIPHDFFVIACMSVLIYSIMRFRLMDITIVITKVSLFIIVYTLVLGVPFAAAILLRPGLIVILGSNWWIAPLSLMALFATSGPFIYIYLNKRAEDRLLKEQKRYQDTLKKASLGMTRIRELDKLLKLIVYVVAKSVRLNFSSIYILDNDNALYKLGAEKNKSNALVSEISSASSLINWLSENKEALVFEEIKRRMHDTATEELEDLRSQMVSIDAAVIIPSFIGDRLLAFMVLGEKRSGEIYSQDDLRVFTVLANQAALAIENARFFEEAKEMQEQIAQAEKMATIGTMADGLSHQINNRFHALSMIAGDTMDTIHLVDMSAYTPEQKELITQIQHSLERIQANVVQGGEVVKGMLKYTRKGDAGLMAITLDKVLDAALEMVQYKIKLSMIDIVRDYPKDIASVLGNLTQLQEVFFNLIDNAYDAMMERKDTLKEEGYRGKIRIYTENINNGFLTIHIEDTGIGVKPEDFKKMFTPFFTTKVSSRRGTGLGLYVIKKIVASNHGGTINVSSTYKQGTRFTIELPVHN